MPSQTFATSGTDLIGHTIDNGRLELLSVLGVGAYGVVYLAVDLHAPSPVYLAVKCLLRAGLDSRQRHFQRREIALHQLASRHPNVVTLHKVLEEGDCIFVVMDFCDEGDLFGMITERQRYLGNDYLIKKVFLQIVDAVEYCHSMGIFHRDLKPENILCTRNGERVCIADFGLATSERTSTDFGCGSTFYLSPECQGGLFERRDRYSTETNDIWSLGVILVNFTCGRNPWRQACPSDETFRAYVHNPDFLRTILPISKATNRILKGLFALDPARRTTLQDLRRQILAVESFTMSEEELRCAHSAARAAAAAVRVPAPVAAPAAAPPPAPAAVPAYAHAPPPTPVFAHAPVSAVAPPRIAVDQYLDPKHDADAHVQANWSTSDYGSASTSASGSDQIMSDSSCTSSLVEFPEPHPHPHLPSSPRTTPRSRRRQHREGDIPSFDSDTYALAPTSSRSSSSEDTLPPTPEFDPADKQTVPVSRWDIPDKVPRQDILVQRVSPVSGDFLI